MGTSPSPCRYKGLSKDHPHACGDKNVMAGVNEYATGSSPRVWGQALPSILRAQSQQDHPHACGDKAFPTMPPSTLPGSSPRVWGQELHATLSAHRCRIIPTRVGTRFFLLPFGLSLRDHPHACGDKVWSANTIFGIVGSSPRVWGQVTSFV